MHFKKGFLGQFYNMIKCIFIDFHHCFYLIKMINIAKTNPDRLSFAHQLLHLEIKRLYLIDSSPRYSDCRVKRCGLFLFSSVHEVFTSVLLA